ALGQLRAGSRSGPAAPLVADGEGPLDPPAFRDRMLRCAAGLRNAGVCPGARVALWLPNSTSYLAAIFACARLGALAIHINTRFRASEVGYLLRQSGAVAIVTEWGFAPADFPAIFAALLIEDRAALRTVLGVRIPAGVTKLPACPAL